MIENTYEAGPLIADSRQQVVPLDTSLESISVNRLLVRPHHMSSVFAHPGGPTLYIVTGGRGSVLKPHSTADILANTVTWVEANSPHLIENPSDDPFELLSITVGESRHDCPTFTEIKQAGVLDFNGRCPIQPDVPESQEARECPKSISYRFEEPSLSVEFTSFEGGNVPRSNFDGTVSPYFHQAAEELIFIISGRGLLVGIDARYPIEAGHWTLVKRGVDRLLLTDNEYPLKAVSIFAPAFDPDRVRFKIRGMYNI